MSIIDEGIIYHDIIESMVAALEARDLYTSGHSTRVSDMTYKLCKHLNLSDEILEMYHIAAHLHDIGKIGVSDNVLNKRGKLDFEEWQMMKKHSEIGYKILGKAKSLKNISYIVLYHHERWDGKGYPEGLKKNAIPLGSRIIALCDSIDAMKSNRPYRDLISDKECFEEILINKGVMYDPEITDCILENWNDVVTKYYRNL
ncbi:HD-GYP domain-containing protein [Clostridium botulinum]|uniref:HD-GYP domain-containing protein n=1 Tax=Clostridium botulinum TaxID=1491 RepID=UPI000773C766|nr:HD domain-containing phosphohydrolase [Clostridium botulinum]NFE93663.1 HD domain-containing protein [Clostridium botulinum]NFL38413.1 HD domain-containing protein [Clostridium botulinum]NFL65490.1 HD domain-containing protein [Clostridium botulinum]NFN08250.1 HD domain-containing protein [Clostridium botulinum]NFN24437.1 HD domain-containing protein [Clostridium botulinum]